MQIFNMNPTLDELTGEQRAAVAAFQREHGVRVPRAVAMALLSIADHETFNKVVDATPALRHRLPGESRDKYVTAVIYQLRPEFSRCATRGEAKSK